MINKPYLPLAGLFFVQSLSRGILMSVIPLQAYSLFGDAQKTSTLFFAVSAGGILAALSMPVIIRRIGNHASFILGSALMFISACLLYFNDPWLFSIGLFFHIFSIAAVEVSLTLYVLARIPRKELTRFEPLRIFAMVSAFTIGPFLGVYMEERWFHASPYIFSATCVLLSYTYFRALNLHRQTLPASGNTEANPLRYVARFFRQPRLTLAYLLVLARGSWWTMFVIYAPIYAVSVGKSEIFGAAVVSIGTAWTLTVPFWGWVGRKFGVRFLLRSGFLTASILTFGVFLVADMPTVASVLLVFCALGATMLDGMGNVLFLRAVKSRERSEMTAVFSTYRDFSQLAVPGLYAVLLKFFALPVVFLSASVWMLAAAWSSRYIPGRMR